MYKDGSNNPAGNANFTFDGTTLTLPNATKSTQYIYFGTGGQTNMSISNNFNGNNALTLAGGTGDGSSKAFRLVNSGNTSELMTVNTSGDVFATSFTSSSTRKLKTNIRPLSGSVSNAINILNMLQPVMYDRIDFAGYNDEIGLIAEDVYTILPTDIKQSIVALNGENEPEGVDYSRLVVILLQAIKELKIEIDNLKNK